MFFYSPTKGGERENDRQLVTCQLSNCHLILFYFNPFPSPSSSHIGQQHNTAYFVKVAFGNLQSLLQLGRAAIRNSQTRTPPPPSPSPHQLAVQLQLQLLNSYAESQFQFAFTISSYFSMWLAGKQSVAHLRR